MTEYTTSTTNDSNTITAGWAAGCTGTVQVNGSEHKNGTPATWDNGENTVVIKVTNGSASKIYTVTVTKQEA